VLRQRKPCKTGVEMPKTSAFQTGGDDAPRYALIQTELQSRIVEGQYPIGSLMPTEKELSAEFETSRFTVRAALRNLSVEGFVERRQGMGTRVVSSNPQLGYEQSFETLQELFQIAVDTYLVILAETPIILDAPLARVLGGEDGKVVTGERWIRVDCVRWTAPGGRPLCFIQSYVPERFAPLVSEFSKQNGPFFDLLERKSGETIIEAQQDIRALPMPNEMARAIGLKSEAQAVQLARRYITARGVLIVSLNWHPADQMVFRTKVRRRPATD